MVYKSMEREIRDIMEKKLTPAEKKKREEVAQAIERDNPDMPMDQKMAIATSTAKKVAEDVEVIAEDMKSAAKELRSYADKSGGVDKDDFHKAAKHMEAGDHDAIHKHVNRLDTSPRDKVLETLHKHGNDIKRYGYTMEEVELDEATPTAKQVKQGIGIARDKRYAGGNMTGAVKTMDKINKGLAGHPAVSKELQKQNEAVDPADTGGAEEVSMVMNQVKQIRHYIDGIEKMVASDGDMEEWVQNKLTKATDYLKSVYGYKTGKNEEVEVSDEMVEEIIESTAAYGKSMEKQADDKKKAAITDSDKQKLGALANLMAKERMKKEEVELDELDKKTLGSYINKASRDAASKAYSSASAAKDNNPEKSGKDFVKSIQRVAGVKLAVKKISKEEVELDELAAISGTRTPKRATIKKKKEDLGMTIQQKIAARRKAALTAKEEYAEFEEILGEDFEKHLKYAVSNNKNVQSYLSKKVDQRRAMNKKNDPGADKKGLALSVVDRQKAYQKGKKRGIGVMDINTRPGKDHATGKPNYKPNLPEEIEEILNTVITETQGENNE